jgi:hypothetical protein
MGSALAGKHVKAKIALMDIVLNMNLNQEM